jgi:hypothetical protein
VATEQDRANLTGVRGQQAAKMEHEAAKDYIKGSAKVDKDYQGTAEETAGVSKKQQTQEILGSFKRGGMVKKTGAYKLHKGEKVLTSGMVKHGKNGNMIRKGSAAMSPYDKDN